MTVEELERSRKMWLRVIAVGILVFLALNVMDVVSTYLGIEKYGMIEANPHPREVMIKYGFWVAVAEKMVICLLSAGAFYYLLGGLAPRSVAYTLIVLNLILFLVVASNFKVVASGPEWLSLDEATMELLKLALYGATVVFFIILATLAMRDTRMWKERCKLISEGATLKPILADKVFGGVFTE